MAQRRSHTGSLAAGLALLALLAPCAVGVARAERPVLGARAAFPGGRGFGSVAPRTVFLGGDPTGLVTHLHWRRWGSARATGAGEGWCPGVSVAAGYRCPASLRATVLGSCHGRPAYEHLAFSFETHKGWIHALTIDVCTGQTLSGA
jgi:hypothetical protein